MKERPQSKKRHRESISALGPGPRHSADHRLANLIRRPPLNIGTEVVKQTDSCAHKAHSRSPYIREKNAHYYPSWGCNSRERRQETRVRGALACITIDVLF